VGFPLEKENLKIFILNGVILHWFHGYPPGGTNLNSVCKEPLLYQFQYLVKSVNVHGTNLRLHFEDCKHYFGKKRGRFSYKTASRTPAKSPSNQVDT